MNIVISTAAATTTTTKTITTTIVIHIMFLDPQSTCKHVLEIHYLG